MITIKKPAICRQPKAPWSLRFAAASAFPLISSGVRRVRHMLLGTNAGHEPDAIP